MRFKVWHTTKVAVKALKYVLWTLLGLVLIVLLWGLVEPYWIDVEQYEVALDDLPAAWEGQEVALVADWQVGMWLDNEPTIERIVDRIWKDLDPAQS